MPEEKILQKLESIDAKLDNHTKKFIEHDEKFDLVIGKQTEHDEKFELVIDKLAEHEEKLELVAGKLSEHDKKFDIISGKLIEHDDRFEKLEDKMDNGFRKVTDTLEGIATTVSRLDQERIFTAEWVKRIEKDVEDNTREIKDMKLKLNIV